jgi:hypothetical protein
MLVKTGPLDQREGGVTLVPDVGAYDVCGQEVWGELHASVATAGATGKHLGQESLAQSGIIFEEDVAVGDACRQ